MSFKVATILILAAVSVSPVVAEEAASAAEGAEAAAEAPKENPELVGRLFIEFYYGSIAIVFRKVNKNGSISRNTSYISNFSYTQTFEGYPKLTAKLVKLFEPVGDSE